ncbi:hypothetical protein C8J56DRAFT_916277 [Mycena floridula]|nr:hypothetical protein C8J56DRAFT_916277 [Mycena floridula]
MLPFALKVVWFALSLIGLGSCWVVLLAFAATVSTLWGPLMYCIGVTVLQGSFCLGMIWHMDPFRMPKAFCVAQTVLFGFAACFLTGICTSFAFATNHFVRKPKNWDKYQHVLVWRNCYLIPLVVVPLAATGAQLAVILKLDAVGPSDDMHCDVKDPIWARFLGYAGIPFLLSLPSLYFTILTIYRISKINSHIKRAQTDAHSSYRRTRPSPSPVGLPMSPGRAPIRPGFTSPVLSAKQFHLPFTPPPLIFTPDPMGSSSSLDEPDSPASSSPPTFRRGSGHPIAGRSPSPGPSAPYQFRDHTLEQDYLSDILEGTETPDTSKSEHDKFSALMWTRQDQNELRRPKSDLFNFQGEEQEEEGEDGFVIVGDPLELRNQRRPPSRLLEPLSPSRNLRTLVPIWRIVIFQVLFTCCLLFASISTIVDVALNRKTPTPMGTQHVALLLAAYGPTVLFGTLPSVRQQLGLCRPK